MIGAKTDFHVTAHLDTEGKASVVVRGSRSYGKKELRHATVSKEITDKKTLDAIGTILKTAIASVEDQILFGDRSPFVGGDIAAVKARLDLLFHSSVRQQIAG